MGKAIFFLIIFTLLSNTVWATDPIIGTWKLNYEKSKLNQSADEQNSKEEINVYRETEDNKIELATTTLLKDGSTESSKWIWPKEGGVAKCVSRKIPENMLYVEIVVEPGHWYVPIMRDGRKVSMYHKKVSKDRKTLTQTLKGLGRDGNPVDILMVWDRQ